MMCCQLFKHPLAGVAQLQRQKSATKTKTLHHLQKTIEPAGADKID